MKTGRIVGVLFALLLFMAACSNDSAAPDNEAEAEETVQTDAEDEEAGIEVEKGLLNVELTLPSSIFDEEDLTEIEAELQEMDHADITQNDDGSFTVKMSKKDHKAMMAEMKEDIIATMDEIVNDEDYGSIQGVDYNEDFTTFKMIVSNQADFENSFDAFATLSVGMSGLLYQAFNGKDIEKEKVTLQIEDASTNEVFHEIVYPDAFEEMEE